MHYYTISLRLQSITSSRFHSAQNLPFQKILSYTCSAIVCWTDPMALDLILYVLIGFFWFYLFRILAIRHVRQTKLGDPRPK